MRGSEVGFLTCTRSGSLMNDLGKALERISRHTDELDISNVELLHFGKEKKAKTLSIWTV